MSMSAVLGLGIVAYHASEEGEEVLACVVEFVEGLLWGM
jgi:hypothetical protein